MLNLSLRKGPSKTYACIIILYVILKVQYYREIHIYEPGPDYSKHVFCSDILNAKEAASFCKKKKKKEKQHEEHCKSLSHVFIKKCINTLALNS